MSPFRQLPLVLLALIFCAAPARAVVTYAPPDESADLTGELQVIDRELAAKNYDAAAKRLAVVLESRGGALASAGEPKSPAGSVSITKLSIRAWFDALAEADRAGLRKSCESEYGKLAAQQLDGLRRNPDARPEDGYAIARRFPLSHAAGEALVGAGDLAARLGDVSAARTLYDNARRHGASLGDDREKSLHRWARLHAGEWLAAPKDLADAPPANAPLGEVPADARWYGVPDQAIAPKFFPLADGAGGAIVTSWTKTLRIGADGHVVWSVDNPATGDAFGLFRFAQERAQGPLFRPAVQFDAFGRPALVVVRQPGRGTEDTFDLRAYAGADGQLLWTTDSPDGRRDLSYTGLPTIAGRHVYVLGAARVNQSTAAMTLSAVDAQTGRPAWQANLGNISESDIRFGRGERAGYLSLWKLAEWAEPAVWADVVIVSPGAGSVIAVDRFDGKVRWVHTYADPLEPPAIVRGRVDPVALRQWEARQSRRSVARYRATPVVCDRPTGGVVVAMPQDSTAVYGLDAATGRRIWTLS
ncbi:MAG TPA: PQQ-binding-like beta-propeller repeat protein, partial [Tepidisphaeraceae bacterium]|nr:PQQ-binding-like beta-propeller repeat protein [Tepidisphaeraceae bacterium]